MIGTVARLECNGADCVATFEVMLDGEIELRDVSHLLSRAASWDRWMFVFGKPHCPTCSQALQASLLTSTRGAWAEAIKLAIVERASLSRVEVELR